MIIGSRFDGDSNDELMRTQHESYGHHVFYLFREACSRYLDAAALMEIETDLAEAIRSVVGFDHRVLQVAHDKIAAYYRYQLREGRQLEFQFGSLRNIGPQEAAAEAWPAFWRSQVSRVIQEHRVLRAVLKAVAYQNTELGYKSEDLLRELLDDIYGSEWDVQSRGS